MARSIQWSTWVGIDDGIVGFGEDGRVVALPLDIPEC